MFERHRPHQMALIACCTAALAACAVDVSATGTNAENADEEVSLTEQAIIGGTTKSLGHWEVGQFLFPNTGKFCTATLITDQWFVMAAHCVGYKGYVPPQETNGAVFVPRDPAASRTAVDRVWTYNGDDSEWNAAGCSVDNPLSPSCNTGVGQFDVALGRLASPINNSGRFDVAKIPVAGPAFGETVTRYGYGCMTVGGPAGTLNKKTYPFGPTSIGCGGDSGGPVFGSDGVSIPLVNSGGGPGFTDVFGDLTLFKERIWRQIRQTDVKELHTLRVPPVDNGFVTDEANCVALCRENAACHSYSFDSSTSTCWIQDALYDPSFQGTNSPVYTVVTGVNLGSEASLVPDFGTFGDRPFSDIGAPFTLPEPAPMECAWKCAENASCKSWTLVLATSQCYIKSAVPTLQVGTSGCPGAFSCISGVKRTPETKDRPDFRIGSSSIKTWEQCKTACAQRGDCLALSWNPANSKCYLNSRVGAPVDQFGMFSAVRGGIVNNVAFSANNIEGAAFNYATTDRPLPEPCQAACARNPNCKAWTFAQVNSGLGGKAPDGVTDVPRCYLKSDFSVLQTNMRGMVSGTRAAFEERLP